MAVSLGVLLGLVVVGACVALAMLTVRRSEEDDERAGDGAGDASADAPPPIVRDPADADAALRAVDWNFPLGVRPAGGRRPDGSRPDSGF